MERIQSTPPSLVEGGKIHYGRFSREFELLNILDAPFYGSRLFDSRLFKRFRLKEWQHFGIIHPDRYFGFVVMNAKYMAVSFFYIYDRNSRVLLEHKHDFIVGSRGVAKSLYEGRTHFAKRGYAIEVRNDLADGKHHVNVEIEARAQLPPVSATITVEEDQERFQPLVATMHMDGGGPFYTHKNVCPVQGSVTVGGETTTLSKSRDLAMIDVQKTAYPYRSFWNWVCLGGYDDAGRLIGINLTKNNRRSDTDLNENCVWVDGVIHPCGAVVMDFGDSPMNPWEVHTSCETVQLSFSPHAERAERINMLVAESSFHQPIGLYNGQIRLPSGEQYQVKDLFGVAEEHTMRW